MDWQKAIEYLSKCEEIYASIGSTGYIALNFVIRPLRDRLNNGERTQELYDEIMEVKL